MALGLFLLLLLARLLLLPLMRLLLLAHLLLLTLLHLVPLANLLLAGLRLALLLLVRPLLLAGLLLLLHASLLALLLRRPCGRGATPIALGIVARFGDQALAHLGITRLEVILLLANGVLPFARRIAVASVLTLVHRQRGRRRRVAMVPAVPAAMPRFPVRAPVRPPARWFGNRPAAEVRRQHAVVAHRHAQHVHRHDRRLHQVPRAVVPELEYQVSFAYTQYKPS